MPGCRWASGSQRASGQRAQSRQAPQRAAGVKESSDGLLLKSDMTDIFNQDKKRTEVFKNL